jgi:Uma2 family endonuclease
MVSIIKPKSPPPPDAEPAWDIARLFPLQGQWDSGDYLALETNRLIEFTDGFIEVLPIPDMRHQLCLDYLVESLKAFVKPRHLGRVLFAPFSIQIRPNKFREPNLMFMLAEHAGRMSQTFWDGADLVMEIGSDDRGSQKRDHETKRVDYAEAGIPEYWIVDPAAGRVMVLELQGSAYQPHGEFGAGQMATSALLAGFQVDVNALFTAGHDS